MYLRDNVDLRLVGIRSNNAWKRRRNCI